MKRVGASVVAVLLVCFLSLDLEALGQEKDERVEAPVASRGMPEVERIFVRSYDGAYLPAAWRKPAGDGPLPAILYIHGGVGGHGQDAAARMLTGRVPSHFHERGFVGMATDYRRFHFGEDEIQDVLAAYRELESLPFVDKARIAVIGGSHGGYLAQMLASRIRPAATVSFAGLSDVEGMFYEAGLELRKNVRDTADWREQLTTPREAAPASAATPPRRVPGGNAPLRPGSAGYEVALELGWRFGERRDLFRAISPKENTHSVQGPVMYLVGGEDALREAGKAWIEALNQRGVTAEYSEHEGMPHGFYWGNGENPPKQFFDALETTTRFIERHLKVAQAAEAQPAAAGERRFKRTRVIGYSQVGSPRGGWYVAGGVFESIVGDEHWELLWGGGAGVDRWRKADYAGWSRPLISPCPGDDPPDRVLLSVSGPYGDDEKTWAEAISETVSVIRQKLPSVRQIVLQPVVGGPGGKACPPPGGEGRVRASWQHNHIASAIGQVVKQHKEANVEVIAGFAPQVRSCADYTDGLGHLTPEAAQAIGRTIGEYYARLDGKRKP
jgi:acetyl esterase/lipase